MRIGIIGSGDVGRTLGYGFTIIGHKVKLGSRNPEQDKIKEWLEKCGEPGSAGSFDEAAAYGEMSVLATAWSGTKNAIAMINPKNLDGKPVIDVTNPLEFPENSPPRLTIGFSTSAGEEIQRLLPGSYVVKAFNIVGNAHMVNPSFPGGPPDMFICGNDEGAKSKVTAIIKALGWPVIDLGAIEASRYLEPMAMVWIMYFMQTKTYNHAFKLLRK
jgi:8-hydroxy-5-deazaflavin:NADPH oxidoreductase